MASKFNLALCPFIYHARYVPQEGWQEHHSEQPTTGVKMAADLAATPDLQTDELHLPLVTYTNQYGYGCFEGLKAYPQPDGGLKLFRPQESAARMHRSMIGMRMPAFPEQMFTAAVIEVVRRNRRLDACPQYDPSWSTDKFIYGHALYVRPFSYSEDGIGLNIPRAPWVVVIATPVGSYFDHKNGSKAITTKRIRATTGGTGWIKCSSNYVISILAKDEAQSQGYMEAIFLDACEQRYVEECSSCNIFFYMHDGTLVTPSLEDRILPGITRKSVIQLARDMGVTVEERPIEIDEALDKTTECFVTGTAVGVEQIESITHVDRTAIFNDRAIGDLTRQLRDRLKGIQYGAIADTYGWMVSTD